VKVTLLSHTPEAAELLLFTKSTRLTLSPSLMDEIRAWTPEKKLEELRYMANTIPSSWEFVDYVFMIEGVSRAYTHQQVRTRAASYAQQTMRVLDMGDFDYVFTDCNKEDRVAMAVIVDINKRISAAYKTLVGLGQAPEDARGILPTNIATNLVAKFNLRTLSELCKSRTGGRTQGEYQRVINGISDAVLAVHPWASEFLFPQGRDAFKEIEDFAAAEFGGDLLRKGKLLKIVDRMRKGEQ
jgi:flavin-dependent thymidylate synthase